MTLSPQDREALRYAKSLLEQPGLATRLTGLIGMPVEKAIDLLPERWSAAVAASTRQSLETALHVALTTLDERPRSRSWDLAHKLAVVATGAGGGAFGLAGCRSSCRSPRPSCCGPLPTSRAARARRQVRPMPGWPASRCSRSGDVWKGVADASPGDIGERMG